MDLLTLWLGMIAVLLLFGLLMWLRPEWFLWTIWVHPPHHLCDEAISHLYGEGKRGEQQRRMRLIYRQPTIQKSKWPRREKLSRRMRWIGSRCVL